jgi:ubiquinone/menaquinone biosynthesis C-methylase UbiE
MKQSNETFEFWNNKDTTEYFKSKDADPRLVEFVAALGDTRGQRALDLGCGGGRHSEFFVQHDFNTSAVDINPAMLATTNERVAALGKTIDLQEGSILGIPYLDNEFDIVLTTGVLHQAQNLDQYATAIQELSRVTKPGGHVFLNIFTDGVWDDTYTQLEEFGVMTKEGLTMTLLPKELFVELMREEGLRLFIDYGEDIKEENTGPRAVYRAIFAKENAGE